MDFMVRKVDSVSHLPKLASEAFLVKFEKIQIAD